MLAPYRTLLAVPHLGAVLFLSVLSRLHVTGTSLALTFLVAGWTGSYALSGLVIGALTVGIGVSGPWRGRLADRRSAPRVLITTCSLYAAGMLALAALPGSAWPVAPVIALGIGLCAPPVGPVARAAYARLADAPTRSTVFAAEATLFELVVMAGPLLASTMIALAGPRAALVLIAALTLGSGLGFAAALRRAGLGEPVPAQARAPSTGRSVLTVPGLVPALLAAMLLAAGFSSVTLSIVALGRGLGLPAVAGVLVAVWAVGSMIGGLIAGSRAGAPRYAPRVAGLAAGVALLAAALPPLTNGSPVLVGAVLAVGGLAVSPAVAAGNQRLGDLAPEGRAAEVFGWLTTCTTTGSALAAPLIGHLLDSSGPAAAVACGALAALLATGCAHWSTRRTLH